MVPRVAKNHVQQLKIWFLWFLVDDEEARNVSNFVGPFKNVNIQSLITVVILALLGLFVGLACVISALHRVHEGHVGKSVSKICR